VGARCTDLSLSGLSHANGAVVESPERIKTSGSFFEGLSLLNGFRVSGRERRLNGVAKAASPIRAPEVWPYWMGLVSGN
jgi:hypothetical protein